MPMMLQKMPRKFKDFQPIGFSEGTGNLNRRFMADSGSSQFFPKVAIGSNRGSAQARI
jgi:hypothetical protein